MMVMVMMTVMSSDIIEVNVPSNVSSSLDGFSFLAFIITPQTVHSHRFHLIEKETEAEQGK